MGMFLDMFKKKCWIPKEDQSDMVLSSWSLRFKRRDLELKYLECHWRHQNFWIRGAIIVITLYSFFWIMVYALGDEDFVNDMDFRVSHYKRTNVELILDSGTDKMLMVEENRYIPIRIQNNQVYVHPQAFIAWHMLWCLSFLILLVTDRSKKIKRYQHWDTIRHSVTCGIMTLDLAITAFVNPTVTRFLLFVYTLLIRVTWVQTLWLVVVCSVAIVFSGQIGGHQFLTQVSVTEFVLSNVVALIASRQLEINQRLSLYRLWLLKCHVNVQPQNRGWNSSEILSLKEYNLHPIQENEEEESREESDDESPQRSPKRSDKRNGKREHTPPYASPKVGNLPTLIVPGDIGSATSPPESQTNNSGASTPNSKISEVSVFSYKTAQSGSMQNGSLPLYNNQLLLRLERIRGPVPAAPMYVHDPNNDPWRQSENSENSPSTWNHGTSDMWKLRTKTYLDGKKEKAISPHGPMFILNAVKYFSYPKKLFHVANEIQSLKTFLMDYPDNFFLITNRICPIKANLFYSQVSVFEEKPRLVGSSGDNLWQQFLKEGHDFKQKHFKYICDLPEAPYFLRKSLSVMGALQRPVIMGHGYLHQVFHQGSNYLEVDIDISSSSIARAIMSRVMSFSQKCIIEECFLIEGQTHTCLPERPLALQRLNYVSIPSVLIELADGDLVPEGDAILTQTTSPLSPPRDTRIASPRVGSRSPPSVVSPPMESFPAISSSATEASPIASPGGSSWKRKNKLLKVFTPPTLPERKYRI